MTFGDVFFPLFFALIAWSLMIEVLNFGARWWIRRRTAALAILLVGCVVDPTYETLRQEAMELGRLERCKPAMAEASLRPAPRVLTTQERECRALYVKYVCKDPSFEPDPDPGSLMGCRLTLAQLLEFRRHTQEALAELEQTRQHLADLEARAKADGHSVDPGWLEYYKEKKRLDTTLLELDQEISARSE